MASQGALRVIEGGGAVTGSPYKPFGTLGAGSSGAFVAENDMWTMYTAYTAATAGDTLLGNLFPSGLAAGVGAVSAGGFAVGTQELLAEIEGLKSRVAALESAIEVIDELDWQEALKRARAYFDSRPGQKIYPDELAGAIRTSISQAIDVCEALEKEGAVAGQ